MKKIILLFSVAVLCLLLCIGLVSCGGNDNVGGTENNGTQTGGTEDNGNTDPNTEYVTITFDTQGGSAIESIQVEKGGKIPKPSDPERLGYELKHWYIDGNKWPFYRGVTKDMTLKASWTPISYEIEYVCDASHYNRTSYTIETEVDLTDAYGEGYTFLGWYEDQEYTKPITKIEKGTTGNLIIYAKTEYQPLTFEESGGGYTVVDCLDSAKKVVIPNTYNDKPVEAIGYSAFENCTNLESVIISSGITKINQSAFYSCKKLESVTIQNGIEKIGSYAFSGCTSLASVEIPNSVTTLGEEVFSGCTSLEEITIPFVGNGSDKTHFGYIFGASSYSYNDVYVPTSLKKVTIIDGKIGANAFSNCTNLASIEIPSSVTTIGEYAFYKCLNLTIYCEAKSKPSGWDIDWNCSYCTVVWNVKEYGTTEDGIKWATTNDKPNEAVVCGITSGTTNIKIPEKINNLPVTTIGELAFYKRTNLESITIPSSVTTIFKRAFYDCDNLTIYCEAESKPSGWNSGWNYSNCLVVWNVKEYGTTNDGIKWASTNDNKITIYDYLGNTTSVTIPEKINNLPVTTIGNAVFSGCTNLANIEIPSSVTTIGNYVFSGCTRLASIEIPNSVTTIGEGAFYNCRNLESIEIPNGVTTLGEEAFSGCTSLASIEIPSSVTTIGRYAFEDCGSLTIYCEAESEPSGWNSWWNNSKCPVVWDYKNK
ncbi:MAG: leucine-rich repeat protein [Clostridia bacterium]|nr:leucine-rich repeat protein [Clostridia bacterium]